MKIIGRTQMGIVRDWSTSAPPQPEYWTGANMVRLRMCDRPKFNQFQHEPKEIVGSPPVLNLQCATEGREEFLEEHKEVQRTRPKVPGGPCEPILDDVEDPEGRETFLNYTYSMDKIPEAKLTNVQIMGEPVEIPASDFSTGMFVPKEKPYRQIKPSLKHILRYHESIQERNYDNFDINFLRKDHRKDRFADKADEVRQRQDMDPLERERLLEKYPDYGLGYTGHISIQPRLGPRRKCTVHPMLSYAKAIESRRDDSSNLANIKKMDPDQRRTELGLVHLPVDSYYHPCITNRPYRMRSDCVDQYDAHR